MDGTTEVREVSARYDITEKTRPNAKTLAAIAECEDAITHPEKYKWYDDVDEMFQEILS